MWILKLFQVNNAYTRSFNIILNSTFNMFFSKQTQSRVEIEKSICKSTHLLSVTVLGTRNIEVAKNRYFKYSSLLKGQMQFSHAYSENDQILQKFDWYLLRQQPSELQPVLENISFLLVCLNAGMSLYIPVHEMIIQK